jgi:DnaJ-class molecular chaperone
MQECNYCQGRKKVLGMGGMKEDCHVCDGKGTIEEQEKLIEAYLNPANDTGYIADVYIPTQEEIDNPHPGTILELTMNPIEDMISTAPLAEEPAIKPKANDIYKAKNGETVVMAELPAGTVVDISEGDVLLVGETKAKAKKK